MIGKDASVIANAAGFRASGAEILVTPIGLIQPEEKLIREKLAPVLAFGRVAGLTDGIAAARSVQRHSGKGHSAVVHSNDERTILAYADAVPALRTCVNVGCSLGAAGFETNIGPSMTIGTGFIGGSSVGANLKPENFLNMSRIAYNKSEAEAFGNFEGLSRKSIQPPQSEFLNFPVQHGNSQPAPSDAQSNEIRQIIREELKAILAA
jgi:hypothetical protein